MPIEIVKADSCPKPAKTVPGLAAVVSSRREAARAEAEREVADARAEAEALVARAHAEAETVREAARRAGYDEGARSWTAAAVSLAERRASALGNIERACVELSLEIARQIVGAAVRLDRATVDEIAARACAPLRRDAALALRVSPHDAGRAAEIAARLGNGRAVVVEPDPTLAPGDCVAECAGVRVDARLDTQLAVIRERLTGDEGRRR